MLKANKFIVLSLLIVSVFSYAFIKTNPQSEKKAVLGESTTKSIPCSRLEYIKETYCNKTKPANVDICTTIKTSFEQYCLN